MSNHVKIKKRLSVIRYPLNNGRNLLLFPLFILILIFSACGGDGSSSDPKVIAAELRKTLTNGDYYEADSTDTTRNGFTTVIGEKTITLSDGNLDSTVTITGVYTEGGGAATYRTGEWTYVYKDGEKIGYIGKYTIFSDVWYELFIGKEAKDFASIYEIDLGITIDTTGIPDYPKFRSWDNF